VRQSFALIETDGSHIDLHLGGKRNRSLTTPMLVGMLAKLDYPLI